MRIAISCGDPAGIGPEIIIKALQDKSFQNHEFFIFSPSAIFDRLYDDFPNLPTLPLNSFIIETGKYADLPFLGEKAAICGDISYRAFKAALEYTASGNANALVTAPINKYSWHLAGHEYPGHTDEIARFFGAKEFAMAFFYQSYRLVLQTIHIPIKDVNKNITQDRLFNKIKLASEFNATLGDPNGFVHVIGLNPHAGEMGKIGKKESTIYEAIRLARNCGINCDGPNVADAFFPKWHAQPDGVVLAMYHDQGLIPFKMIARGKGVNITLGLPIIRTSPDHGTAMDIANECIAKPDSMIEAIKTAIKLRNR